MSECFTKKRILLENYKGLGLLEHNKELVCLLEELKDLRTKLEQPNSSYTNTPPKHVAFAIYNHTITRIENILEKDRKMARAS